MEIGQSKLQEGVLRKRVEKYTYKELGYALYRM
jgi:hypothetical protein